MPLTPGTKIGPYEIVSPLGAGGMGEVYRATDTSLGRQVALKVLPAAFANDAERMARFKREAQVLASLNHPNIASIYGIEGNAIVMELVEGKDLAGPLPLDEALPIARQIAEALEAAHEKGIIHRDLKPANIKVTPQGVVKLLDFGLAKAAEPEPRAEMSNSPTMSAAMTSAGMILGTAAYMSPEQARGLSVDRRADIWAFGVVLLEMLTGKKTYSGDTVADTLAAVIKDTPSFATLPAETPQPVRTLIRRCLEKDPRRRLQWIGEARLVIDDFFANPTAAPETGPAVRTNSSWLPWTAFVIAIIVAGVGWYRATRPEPLRPLIRMTDGLGPESLAANRGVMAISPDGSRIAVTLAGADNKVRINTRLLQQTKLTPLAGTENAGTPFFSQDGQWIGFHADGKLKKIPVEGGAAVTICDASIIRGASWGGDGNIVVSIGNSSALSKVPSAGGVPTPLTKLNEGERTNRWPHVISGSQTVLFSAYASNNIDDARIDAISVKTGERKTVLKGGYSPHYAADSHRSGRLLYLHKNTMFAAPFDPAGLSVTGPAVPVLEEVAGNPTAGGNFALSSTGTLIFKSGRDDQASNRIVLIDSVGNIKPLHAVPGSYSTPRLSPDGKRLAFSLESFAGGEAADIWVKDLDRDTPSRLTTLEGPKRYPVWTPDGKHIVFRHPQGLYWTRADGAGEAKRLTSSNSAEYPTTISPDGKRLGFFAGGSDGSLDIFTAQIGGDPAHPKLGKPELFLGTPFAEAYPEFSPDGRWLAYQSYESGATEIYVRPFPGPGGRWQISNSGGHAPQWTKDGRELFYVANDSRVMAVSYRASGETFTAAKPRVWSEVRLILIPGVYDFDIMPDGKHIVAILPETEEKPKPDNHLTILLNFGDELRRKVP